MGTQVTGRKRIPNREKMTAEDDALSQIAREAEARLAAKRAARAEAREIRMRELERQQKEKYYGLDSKWGHIEQWMEESERYSRHSRRNTSISDDEERMSVGSRGSLRPSTLCSEAPRSRSHMGSVYEESLYTGGRRFSGSSCRVPSEYSGFLGSSSRASSRASSARASPVVEERLDRDFFDKGSRTASTLSAATLASLGGGSSRRGSCDTSISADTEASMREMKDSLTVVEEKYRRAMVSNAQLDNEKSNLMYQVDTLRDTLMELEEQMCEIRREYEEKARDYEHERHAHAVLKLQCTEMKETLKQSEELLVDAQQLRLKQDSYVREISDFQETLGWKEKKIVKHGIAVTSELTTNGDTGEGVIDGHVTSESASQLAQDGVSPSGDSILGKGPYSLAHSRHVCGSLDIRHERPHGDDGDLDDHQTLHIEAGVSEEGGTVESSDTSANQSVLALEETPEDVREQEKNTQDMTSLPYQETINHPNQEYAEEENASLILKGDDAVHVEYASEDGDYSTTSTDLGSQTMTEVFEPDTDTTSDPEKMSEKRQESVVFVSDAMVGELDGQYKATQTPVELEEQTASDGHLNVMDEPIHASLLSYSTRISTLILENMTQEVISNPISIDVEMPGECKMGSLSEDCEEAQGQAKADASVQMTETENTSVTEQTETSGASAELVDCDEGHLISKSVGTIFQHIPSELDDSDEHPTAAANGGITEATGPVYSALSEHVEPAVNSGAVNEPSGALNEPSGALNEATTEIALEQNLDLLSEKSQDLIHTSVLEIQAEVSHDGQCKATQKPVEFEDQTASDGHLNVMDEPINALKEEKSQGTEPGLEAGSDTVTDLCPSAIGKDIQEQRDETLDLKHCEITMEVSEGLLPSEGLLRAPYSPAQEAVLEENTLLSDEQANYSLEEGEPAQSLMEMNQDVCHPNYNRVPLSDENTEDPSEGRANPPLGDLTEGPICESSTVADVDANNSKTETENTSVTGQTETSAASAELVDCDEGHLGSKPVGTIFQQILSGLEDSDEPPTAANGGITEVKGPSGTLNEATTEIALEQNLGLLSEKSQDLIHTSVLKNQIEFSQEENRKADVIVSKCEPSVGAEVMSQISFDAKRTDTEAATGTISEEAINTIPEADVGRVRIPGDGQEKPVNVSAEMSLREIEGGCMKDGAEQAHLGEPAGSPHADQSLTEDNPAAHEILVAAAEAPSGDHSRNSTQTETGAAMGEVSVFQEVRSKLADTEEYSSPGGKDDQAGSQTAPVSSSSEDNVEECSNVAETDVFPPNLESGTSYCGELSNAISLRIEVAVPREEAAEEMRDATQEESPIERGAEAMVDSQEESEFLDSFKLAAEMHFEIVENDQTQQPAAAVPEMPVETILIDGITGKNYKKKFKIKRKGDCRTS